MSKVCIQVLLVFAEVFSHMSNLVVYNSVFGFGAYNQIAWGIVFFIAVYMMYYFVGFKIPTNLFFYSKSASFYISAVIVWVFGRVYKYISPLFYNTAFPAWSFIPNHLFSGNSLAMPFYVSLTVPATYENSTATAPTGHFNVSGFGNGSSIFYSFMKCVSFLENHNIYFSTRKVI